jgi:hypothetical protein
MILITKYGKAIHYFCTKKIAMKTFITLFCALLLIPFTSCKKKNTITAHVTEGKWKVALFMDNGLDETNHYTDYVFTFGSNNTVTATKSGSTVNGTWSDGNDDSQTKFVLTFDSSNSFHELNEDWHVAENTSTTLKLEHVSGGGGGTHYLTFEKI